MTVVAAQRVRTTGLPAGPGFRDRPHRTLLEPTGVPAERVLRADDNFAADVEGSELEPSPRLACHLGVLARQDRSRAA